jgi:hypothetical protein
VAETLSTPEVAHTIGHHHGKTQAEKHAERIEILEAILLAIVAVATAWSGYETGRWDGRQAHLYGLSSKELGLIAVSGCLLAVALYYVITYPVA